MPGRNVSLRLRLLIYKIYKFVLMNEDHGVLLFNHIFFVETSITIKVQKYLKACAYYQK